MLETASELWTRADSTPCPRSCLRWLWLCTAATFAIGCGAPKPSTVPMDATSDANGTELSGAADVVAAPDAQPDAADATDGVAKTSNIAADLDTDAAAGDAADAGSLPNTGLLLVYTRLGMANKSFQIIRVAPDGIGSSVVLANAVIVSQPAAGRMVAWTGANAKAMALEVLTMDGKAVALIAGAKTEPVFGTLSPDGKRVAWTRRLSDDSDATVLAVRDVAAGTDTVLSAAPAWETRPEFSPDGKWLAWYGNDAKLYVANGDGTAPKAVLDGIDDDNDFRNGISWTQDSQRMAITLDYLVAGTDEGMNIGLFDMASGKVSALTTGPVLQQAPAMASDFASVYFTQVVKGESSDIRRVALVGNKVDVLTDGKGYDFLPQPSPDGKFLAYARWTVEDNVGELRVQTLATGAIVTLDAAVFNRAYWVAP